MQLDQDMMQALSTFIVESVELLQTMEEDLLALEEDQHNPELINSIFRAAHTIKGSSGLFGLDHIVAFTHVVESVLDQVRDGKLAVSDELIAILLPCCDHMGALVQAVSNGELEPDEDLQVGGTGLLEQLRPFLEQKTSSLSVSKEEESTQKVEVMAGQTVASGNWHISLRFGIDSLRNGMDPLSFIRYLSTLGTIAHITTLCNAMPVAEAMDAESNYLGFEIDFHTQEPKSAIENVFEFVREDSIIHILPKESAIDDYIQLIRSLPEDSEYLGELLVKSGAVTPRELEQGLKSQNYEHDALAERTLLGEILVEQQAVQQPIVNAALEKQSQIKDSKVRESQSIRVDAERLDKLIDLIGELVISGAGVNLRAQQSSDPTLAEASSEIMRLVEEVRDCALQLRMVQIGTTFSRFQRVVRDVSKELGKDINLLITGGDTEVDKSVVEKIGDPLMHLVRNAMDHGIEPKEVRLQRGKPAQGTLRLNAYHASGNIMIEVGDDGGGLDKERIFQKAVEKGLVAADVKLSDQDIFALIFEPGFSTAQKLSNLSGRGVGMDVVKRNVQDLRGYIEVDSQTGMGSTMRIALPLTLAIIDGFLVSAGNSTFVFPLDRVSECVELPLDMNGRDYMDLRGEVLPLIHLRRLFEIEHDPVRRENVVVVEYNNAKYGFIVDRLLGEFQTVIKPLGKLFTHIRGIAGSTILGNGRVALILDVSALIDQIERSNSVTTLNLSHQTL
jgi:two-component system, chemotaxis family, sensor kinase CheA